MTRQELPTAGTWLLPLALAAWGCASTTTGTTEPDSDGGTTLPDAGPNDPVDGGPGEVDGGPPAECEPAATRAVSCGNCGTASEVCSDAGQWERASECLGQNECPAGTVETRATELCGEEQRICDAECAWTEWEVTVPEREDACLPGDTQLGTSATCTDADFPDRYQTCDDTCTWVDYGDCVDACGGRPRVEAGFIEEICVPSGSFTRGDDDGLIADHPETTVTLTYGYYLERYPVTNARYQDCIDDGACTDPTYEGATSIADSGRTNYPVEGISWTQAREFCEWDGGRLPTEAEWEKAARGSDARLYPWGGDSWDCDIVQTRMCGALFPNYMVPDPVDGIPDAANPGGFELMLGGVREFTSDYYGFDYYDETASLTDPTGPSSGERRTMRGIPRRSANDTVTLAYRFATGEMFPASNSGVRCARRPEAPAPPTSEGM